MIRISVFVCMHRAVLTKAMNIVLINALLIQEVLVI